MEYSSNISAESWDSWSSVITYRSHGFWLPRRDGWTFRFQNLPLKSYIWLCIFLPSRLVKITWLQGDSLRSHSVDTLWSCLHVPSIQISFPFLGSSWRALASNKHNCPRFIITVMLSWRYPIWHNSKLEQARYHSGSLWYLKYCVARKRPIRSEKAMPQTNNSNC